MQEDLAYLAGAQALTSLCILGRRWLLGRHYAPFITSRASWFFQAFLDLPSLVLLHRLPWIVVVPGVIGVFLELFGPLVYLIVVGPILSILLPVTVE